MLIKSADDKTKDIQTLKLLAARVDVSVDVRQKIEQEIRNIQSGVKGEAEAAYEMEFHWGSSKNWMVLHDLRFECEGRVAQIDHLLINRFLEIYVCESKRFSEGVAINEQGEFTAFYNGKPRGIPSPLAQNKRHMAVLESVFKTGQVALPKRLGFAIPTTLKSLVLVSKTARIARPKAKLKEIDCIIKNDQLKSRIEKDLDSDNNLLLAVKIIGTDTLEDFARKLAAAHQPLKFNWLAYFGLANAPIAPTLPEKSAIKVEVSTPPIEVENEKKSKLICTSCGIPVTYNVAKFCWVNKPRFNGKVFCVDCQKNVAKPA